MKRSGFRGIIILTLILSWVIPIAAQSGGQAYLAQPDYDQFPLITTHLDVYDQDDTFITGLSRKDISISENGEQRPLKAVEERSPGVQFVLAINMGPPFAIQDISGQSRWGYLSQHIKGWLADSAQPGSDDLSVISNDGLESTHTEKDTILEAIENYQPRGKETTTNLNVLTRAVDIALDTTQEHGMKPVVLFLTPPPTDQDIAVLQNITSRASGADVRIFTWLISAPEFFTSSGAEALTTMAQETGGSAITFSGPENLPDIKHLLQRLRGTYRIQYSSNIKSSGPHQLQVSVETPQGTITAARDLKIDITPPNPILVPPPRTVKRENPRPEEETTSVTEYQPEELVVEAIIEFPDGHPRSMQKTVLLVNGEPAVINTSPPYDQFKWDLRQYGSDQTVYLSIQAEDQLGLSQTSLQTPVEISVDKPEPTIGNIFQQNTLGFLSLAGILISALVLFILVTRGVIQPASILPAASTAKEINHNRNKLNNPFRLIRTGKRTTRKTQAENATTGNDPAGTLEPYNEEAKRHHPRPFQVSMNTIHVGSNPEQVTILLDHSTVAPQHAVISANSAHECLLSDQGSAAGTWVNFQQLPREVEVPIQHGDIIHFGRLGYVFISAHPDARKEVVVTEEN